MTIRRMWLFLLILMAVISVVINSIVLGALTDRYFKGYLSDNYESHLDQVRTFSKNVLLDDELSSGQLAMEMETHLADPITRIKLYNTDGTLVVDVRVEEHMRMGGRMMGNMRNFRYEDSDGEIDSVEIFDGGTLIGQLNITRYSSIEDSIATRMFKSSLYANSLYSIAIVLVIALLIGIFVSKKMSKDLTGTAKMAQDISLGIDTNIAETKISEIRTIQQSLQTLKTRLKLKNKSRKVLIDELVHQTRTPLTVLKTHLEGFADNIIEMTPKEIKICEEQIENITAIISNMSNMIDAQKDFDTVTFEDVEASALLKQIVGGLKAQFDKKKIDLQLSVKEKTIVKTDRYKLSQAIYNVLTNAYKYTPELGAVKISCDTDADSFSISIEDNGNGISENDMPRIFEAYYRGSAAAQTNGEGLGLYLAKESLQKINGEITVTSKVGVGSKFVITIPKNAATYAKPS